MMVEQSLTFVLVMVCDVRADADAVRAATSCGASGSRSRAAAERGTTAR